MAVEREYWSIDIPGLTQAEAERLRTQHAGEFPFGVHLVDPRSFMVRSSDRPTVELLVRCLGIGLASGSLEHLDQAGVQSMLEDYSEWLAQAGATDG